MALELCVCEALCEAEPVAEGVQLGVPVPEVDCEGDTDSVGLWLGVTDMDALADCVADRVMLPVRVTVRVRVFVCVGVRVAVTVARCDADLEPVGVVVADPVPDCVRLRLRVYVGDRLGDWLCEDDPAQARAKPCSMRLT